MGLFSAIGRIAASIIRTVGGWISNGVKKVLWSMRNFFVKLVSWTDKAYKQFEMENGVEFDSSQFYIRRTNDGYRRQSVNYIQVPGNQWEKVTFEGTKDIPINEVPDDVLKNAHYITADNAYNITESVDNELSLAYR